MRRTPILLALVFSSAFVEASAQSYDCTFERPRHNGYSKEITATIQVQNRQVVSVLVDSTLIAPERGLAGASCEFASTENDKASLLPQGKEAILKVAGDETGTSIFVIKRMNGAYKIDLTKVSTSRCEPVGIWPRSVIITNGRKRCGIQN